MPVSFVLTVALVLLAKPGLPKATAQSLAPLIDREVFLGDPEIDEAQISPTGNYIAFLKPWHGVQNMWVKKTEEPFSSAKLLTAEAKWPIYGFFWSQDGKYITYQQDHNGDGNHNVFAGDPLAVPDSGSDAPISRNLTNVRTGRVIVYATPRGDPDVYYLCVNDRDRDWFDIYKLKLSTGEKTLFRKNTDRIFAWKFDSEGRLRMAGRNADNGDRELLRVDPGGFTKVYSCKVIENCWPYHFHKDGRRVYLWTSKGNRTLIELVLLDLVRGESAGTELVASDPLQRAGPGNFIFSDLRNELLAAGYKDDRQRYYFLDKQFEADFHWLQRKLPGKEIVFGTHTADEHRWIVTASADTEPGETYLFDRNSRKLTLQYKILGNLPRTALAEMKAVHYPSSDGLDIPAFLTIPKGALSKGLPVVVMPHGGPWARVTWEYDAWTQFFANRGYAVLQPNFRGSEGFGKAFKNAGDQERGRKMQDDLTWGVKYLIAEGTADPKRIGIFGISYGGYATLAGVTFTPNLYAAAIDYNGTSNLLHLVQSQPATSAKEYSERVGDPATEEGRALLKDRSPALHADKIKAPLMIVQGAYDSSEQRGDAEQIVVSLRDRGIPVEYLLASDEGHVFANPVNNMAMFMAVEKFFAKYVGGRCQEGATPEVTARLAAITVDPQTLSEKVLDAPAATPSGDTTNPK